MPEQRGKSGAAAAAAQVRAVLEAAEQSAADLEASARADAERIRAEAERAAGAARVAVSRLADRADELDGRLDELAGGVREAIAALKQELERLREAAAEAAAAGDQPDQVDEAPGAPVAEVPAVVEDPSIRVDPEADDELIAEAEAVAGRKPALEEAEVAEPETAEAVDVEVAVAVPEGARVLALKMALDGHPREETAGYLRENFELDDAEALLDEVYARAGQ
jgi:hypothetical protein